MPLISETEVVRRVLVSDPGEWVDLKARWSLGDQVAVQRQLTTGSQLKGEELTMDMPTVVEAAEFAAMERAIKAWSYPEPVTPATIRQLSPDAAAEIKAKMEELYGLRTDEKKENSASNGATSSKAKAAPPAS